MLIVNADDLGRDAATTDSILSCYENRRITSTSAMVFMEDSQRAAERAVVCGLDVGLHLNFTERFTASNVSPSLREHHGRICRALRAGKYALLFYRPWLNETFRHVIAAQEVEFVRIYGRPPSHLDGHQHMHLASNVLMGHLLPRGSKVRRSFSFRPGEKSFLNRWYRAGVDRCLARRHLLTDYFFSLAQHLAPDRLQRILALAKEANVELMTHPANVDEYHWLMSETYQKMTLSIQTGSYANLEAR